MKVFTFAAVSLIASVVNASAALTPAEIARLASAARVVEEMREAVPQPYWDRARCVAVIPDLKKAAFVVGGEYGKGVMSCRSGSGWSAPVFTQLAKGSWGFQAGAEEVDLVLLVMNESGVQKLLQNKVTLGADASVAAGPVGRQGSVATDAALTAEILAYSRAKGLFAGINLSGGVLRPDEDANRDAYGSGATPRTILASREISAPPEAQPFLRALASVSPATTTTEAATPAPSRSTGGESPARASEADLRARVAEMQQTLDRLLTASSQSTVGTTGATTESGATLTVDRATLLQLRRQLDALMAELERRQ
jgi:SH3 domain-containing YSC84-like protein 1